MNIIHLYQDIDSLSFASQILIDEMPYFHYGDTVLTEKRRFLMAIDRFADSSLSKLNAFRENRKIFNTQKCACLFCDSTVFDDLSCTLVRISEELPGIIGKLQKMIDVCIVLEDKVYFRQLHMFLSKMKNDVTYLLKDDFSDYFHHSCQKSRNKQ